MNHDTGKTWNIYPTLNLLSVKNHIFRSLCPLYNHEYVLTVYYSYILRISLCINMYLFTAVDSYYSITSYSFPLTIPFLTIILIFLSQFLINDTGNDRAAFSTVTAFI
jgi:hypothetical protein